jgi:hypothetical protein
MDVTDLRGGVGWKGCCEELVIPRVLKGEAGVPDRSSLEESQDGPVELTGLLARGLKMARRSGDRGPLSWRAIAGAIIGDIGAEAIPAWGSLREEAAAAWRRREGARWRWAKLGEGSAASGRVGLSAGDGL